MYCFLVEPFPSKPSPQLMLQLCHAVQSLYLSDSTRLPNMTTIILQEMNQINVQMRLSGHSSVESAVVFSRDEKFQASWMFLDVRYL